MKKCVYISGKVTGLNRHEAMSWFQQAEDFLVSHGYAACNPMRLIPEDASWCSAMDIALDLMYDCHAVILLNNWRDSRGAIMEKQWAEQELKIPVFEDLECLIKNL